MVFFLCALGFRMAVLTIVEGEEYRAIADIKKIKDIPVKAPRGKIFDRNGVLLADNVSSFTVQMYTDEIERKNFNEISYILSKILDKNGEKPIDEFPIELYTFDYIDESLERAYKISENQEEQSIDTISYISAEEKVIQTVKANIGEWLNFEDFFNNEAFNPKEKTINTILRDMDVPIKLENNQYMFSDLEDEKDKTEILETETPLPQQLIEQQGIEGEIMESEEDPIKKWLSENELNEKSTPEQVIGQLLVKITSILQVCFQILKSESFHMIL